MTTRTSALTGTIAILLCCWAGPVQAQDSPERVKELRQLLLDWEALGKLSKEVMNEIHRWGPNGPYRGVISEKLAERFAIIETYQLQKQPGVESQLAAFEEKYGKTRDAVDKSFSPLLNMKPGQRLPKELEALAGKISGSYPQPERLLRETRAELKGLQTTRVQSADHLATQAKPMIDLLETTRADQLQPRLVRLEEELRFAVAFDPTNPEAKKLLELVETKLSASAELLEAWLDEQVFPTPSFSFSGPGQKAELAASCLKWFQASSEWNSSKGEHPFHVIVSGNWVVAKRNILGQPIQWGLPIYLALWRDAQPKLARVFSLTMVTRVEAGVAKSPPWSGCFVGSSYPMRRAKVPGGDSGSSVSLGGAETSADDSGKQAAAAPEQDKGGWGNTILACLCTLILFVGAGMAVFLMAKGKPVAPESGAAPGTPAPPPAPAAPPPAPATPPAPPAPPPAPQ